MRLFLVILFLGIAGLVGGNYYLTSSPAQTQYRVESIRRADITETVAVTGSAEPTEVRVVQARVPGVVAEVLVDFNDEVKEGDVLARLNSEMQQLQVMQAESALRTAEAAVSVSQAAVERAMAGREAAQADMALAQQVYDNARQNALQKLAPQAKADEAREIVRKAAAGVAEADAQVKQFVAASKQAESQVNAAKDAVALAKLHLKETTLVSNMTGVILNRDIRVGDTVGAGPKLTLGDTSPALFEIAAPLDGLRAVVKVNEADYSRVKVGQLVRFTIDTYPNEVFEGRVEQIRNSPTTDRTVVSYATVVRFENRRDPQTGEWMVRPRSTVSADIEIRSASQVLAVPNAALLFTPSRYDQELPEGRHIVWTVGDNGQPAPHAIQVGISNGAWTEVVSGELKEGQQVIVDEPSVERPAFKFNPF